MEIEGKNMSSAELLELSDKARQAAMEKMILERLEAMLPEIENRINGQVEKAYASFCLLQLAEEKARIQTMQNREASLKAERDSLQQQLEAYQAKLRQMETEMDRQCEQLQTLQATVAEQECQQEGYRRICQAGVSEMLPFIRTVSYEAYVNSLCNQRNISLIYDRMRSDCERGKTENLAQYQQLIHEYIKISNRIIGEDMVQLQKVEPGRQLFDSAYFDKTSESPETGKISRVIYYGLERKGVVLDNCRSLVEVE